MTESIARTTGSALVWRGAQLAGDKLINLARLLILASMLAPEDFGLLALAGIAVDVAMRLTNMGMVPALVQRKELRREHYDVAWTMQLARSVLTASVIALAAPYVAGAFGDARASGLMQVLALRVALQGACTTRLADLYRALNFRILAVFQLTEVIVSTVATIALVSSLGVYALVVGPCIGAAVQLLVSFLVAPGVLRLSTARNAMRELLAFGQWVFLQGVVVVAGSALLQLVIARQLGVRELGLYYLAMRLALLPSNISSEIAGAVAFPAYARLKNQPGAVVGALQTTLICLAMVVIPASLFLLFLAPTIVDHLLGARWTGTEQLIAALAIVNILGMTGDVLAPMFLALGRPAATTATALVLYSLLSLLSLMLIPAAGLLGAAWSWAIAVSITQVAGIFMMSGIVKRPFAGTGRTLLIITITGSLSALGAWTITAALPSFAGLVVAMIVGGGMVVLGTLVADRRLNLGLVATVQAAFPGLESVLRPFAR